MLISRCATEAAKVCKCTEAAPCIFGALATCRVVSKPCTNCLKNKENQAEPQLKSAPRIWSPSNRVARKPSRYCNESGEKQAEPRLTLAPHMWSPGKRVVRKPSTNYKRMKEKQAEPGLKSSPRNYLEPGPATRW